MKKVENVFWLALVCAVGVAYLVMKKYQETKAAA